MNHKKGFTLIELLVVIAIIGVLTSVIMVATSSARAKSRDSARISSIRQISYALELYYYNNNNQYPQCLYPGGSCVTTLNGSTYMKVVPKDPSSGLGYTYAATGSGSNCSGYHLGISLEEKTNKILQSDADSAPKTVCTGSATDFSGISFLAGGQPCNATAGTAQPTNAVNGGSCYDVSGL